MSGISKDRGLISKKKTMISFLRLTEIHLRQLEAHTYDEVIGISLRPQLI